MRLTIFALAVASIGAAAPPEDSRINDEVKAIRKAKPSVVTIKVSRSSSYTTKDVFGSGVIVDERGFVVTNRHVVTGGSNVRAIMADGTEYPALVVLEDALHDLAILKLPVMTKIKAIKFAPSADLEQGMRVIAIGNPYGYTNTVTIGSVAALGREIKMPSGEKLTGLIQIDAAINPGNSGGALLNIHGDLIGINVAMRDGANGIAFALNADGVRDVVLEHLPRLIELQRTEDEPASTAPVGYNHPVETGPEADDWIIVALACVAVACFVIVATGRKRKGDK